MKLHQQIAALRKSKGLTQEELATRTKLTVRTIQRIEGGENIPRSYTLKAIAAALDTPFEYFTAKDNNIDVHSLQLVNLSCFFYIVIPYVHFLVPSHLLRKRAKGLTLEMIAFGKKIIRQQIYWVVALQLSMLTTLAFNFNKGFTISYLWPFLIMYFLNAVLIFINAAKIKRRYKSMIPSI